MPTVRIIGRSLARDGGRVFDDDMIDEQLLTAQAPTDPRRRQGWRAWVAAAAALVLLGSGFWLFTPRLVSDQNPDAIGEVPSGGAAGVPSGADAEPGGDSSWVETYLEVTNSGPLAVTVSEPSFGQLTGTDSLQSAQLGLSHARTSSGPFRAAMTIEPGESLIVFIRIYGSECSDSGSSESLTTIEDVTLRAQVGPFTRKVRVPAWATMQVVTEDGSPLPPCP
jgi:hypothetical protein